MLPSFRDSRLRRLDVLDCYVVALVMVWKPASQLCHSLPLTTLIASDSLGLFSDASAWTLSFSLISDEVEMDRTSKDMSDFLSDMIIDIYMSLEVAVEGRIETWKVHRFRT